MNQRTTQAIERLAEVILRDKIKLPRGQLAQYYIQVQSDLADLVSHKTFNCANCVSNQARFDQVLQDLLTIWETHSDTDPAGCCRWLGNAIKQELS